MAEHVCTLCMLWHSPPVMVNLHLSFVISFAYIRDIIAYVQDYLACYKLLLPEIER